MKRKIILIIIMIAVLTMLSQAVLAQSIEYKNWIPIIIRESTPILEYLPPGDYLSRSGEWVVTFTEPKLVIEKVFADGYMWYFVEIRYKDYPSITAWVREWDID